MLNNSETIDDGKWQTSYPHGFCADLRDYEPYVLMNEPNFLLQVVYTRIYWLLAPDHKLAVLLHQYVPDFCFNKRVGRLVG